MSKMFCPFINSECNDKCTFLDEENMSVCQLALSTKALTDYIIIAQRIDKSLQSINSHLQNDFSED